MFYSLDLLARDLKHLLKVKKAVLISEFLREKGNYEELICLRCDVERDPFHSLEFGLQLKKIGGLATFYFHRRRECFEPKIMRHLQSLGHEVGYHYECLDRAGGDFYEARRIFLNDLQDFRNAGIDVRTVCSHSELGISRKGYHDNVDLFAEFPKLRAEANILGDIFEPSARMGDLVIIPDTLSEICRYRRRIRGLFNEQGPAMIGFHPHRWRRSTVVSFIEVFNDLMNYFSNSCFGRNHLVFYSNA